MKQLMLILIQLLQQQVQMSSQAVADVPQNLDSGSKQVISRAEAIAYFNEIEVEYSEVLADQTRYLDRGFPVSSADGALADAKVYLQKAQTQLDLNRFDSAYNYLETSEAYVESAEDIIDDAVDEVNDSAQKELQRVIDSLNNIGKLDAEDVEEDIASLAEEIQEYEDKADELENELVQFGKSAEVSVLLLQAKLALQTAQDLFDDSSYESAEQAVESGEDILDDVNDILDDVEDGRYEAGFDQLLQGSFEDHISTFSGDLEELKVRYSGLKVEAEEENIDVEIEYALENAEDYIEEAAAYLEDGEDEYDEVEDALQEAFSSLNEAESLLAELEAGS